MNNICKFIEIWQISHAVKIYKGVSPEMVNEVLPDIPDEDDLPENDGNDADDDSRYWDMKLQKLYFHHADTYAYNKRPFLLVGNERSLKRYTLLLGNNSYNFSTFLWELVN